MCTLNRSTISTQSAPSGRTKKAVRATLILIPLLGLQYIVTPFRPNQGTPWEYAYQVTSALVASCQVIYNLMYSIINFWISPSPKNHTENCKVVNT